MPKLKYLNLQHQKLKGSIPDFKLPNLIRLQLNENKLTGSIPDFNLPFLEYLGLSANLLEGSIPNFNNLPKLFLLACSAEFIDWFYPKF
ncbi:MAG: hypothetical protein IPF93_15655 [Saprospiraceae bacterium]|nr:hypothetical protein [Saprospiraceae bacterium]